MPLSLLPDLDQRLTEGQQRLGVFKKAVKDSIAALAQRFAADEPVEQLIRARADFIDQILCRIWRQHVPNTTQATLIAVGGYGRAELHPASDVDVLVLLAQEPEAEFGDELSAFITFLWDIGLDIGHSVRTLDQCVTEAAADITIATSLMESRCLCGPVELFQQMRSRTGPSNIWPGERFFSAKCEEQKARHARFEDTANNLEPNIKSGPGGLRDIQMIGWVVKRHFGADTLAELVQHGFLTEHEYETLDSGQKFLWKIRFALHLLTGQHDDRLLFEYQRSIALQFGYVDQPDALAVEQFMQQYYRTVMGLGRLNEMLLQLFQEAILLHGKTELPVVFNRRFHSINGYLEATNNGLFASYPLAILEVFLILQANPELKGVRASTIRLIHAHLHLIDEHLRSDLRARSLFMEILRQPAGITHAFRRMNRYGVLARYIPAFGKIVGRMQFDLFHVYTVDEHTLMVIRNLRRLAVPRFHHEFPFFSDVNGRIVKPELLYLSALFHDIAKGRGGNHAELGAVDARAFCKRHDLSDYDADMVSWLVGMHLVMSATAQKQDIDDPQVVHEFATLVAEQSRLDYLFLLTMADIRGTDPAKWNSWKQSLLTRLYISTSTQLTRGLGAQFNADELIAEKKKEAKRLLTRPAINLERYDSLWASLSAEYFLQNTPEEIAWHSERIADARDSGETAVYIRTCTRRGADEILICTQDRDNLFAHCVALLDYLQLNILQARIRTLENGLCANSFFVLEKDGSHTEEGERRDDILGRILNGLNHPEYRLHKPDRLPRKLRAFHTLTQMHAQQNAETGFTDLYIRAVDKPGLLAKIGETFAQMQLRVHNARITTLGAVAEDVFCVSDRQDNPVDEACLKQLEQELHRKLED